MMVGGPWYDWAHLRFIRQFTQRNNRGSRRRVIEREEEVPCKLLLFFHEGVDAVHEDNFLVLVHACEWEVTKISTLFQHRTLQYQTTGSRLPKYLVQPCSSIVKPAYCFEEQLGFHDKAPHNKKVIVVLEREKWLDEFT